MMGSKSISQYLLQLPDYPTYTDIVAAMHDVPSNCTVVIDLKRIPKHTILKVIHLAYRYMYRFEKYITSGDKNPQNTETHNRSQTPIIIKGLDTYIHRSLVAKEVHKQKYIKMVRDVINEPANIATPLYMTQWALKLFDQQPNTTVDIYDEERLKKEGFNLVLAVGQGSVNKPYMVVVDYKPQKYHKTICLCGKGVIFDSGGLQIKQRSRSMVLMKADKTGGSISLGITKYFSDMNFPCRIVAIVPFVENSVSGSSVHPGDIIKSFSGKTVEIRHTDAEGRLILADALAFSARYNPDYIMDHATLTGWASSLHCDTSAVFFSTNKTIHDMIEQVGENVGERTWGMPKWIEYMRYCKSKIADLNNDPFSIYGCEAGSGFLATMFMAHFIPKRYLNKWVHFDICNNIDDNIMNANSMNLTIELIKKIVTTGKKKNDSR